MSEEDAKIDWMSYSFEDQKWTKVSSRDCNPSTGKLELFGETVMPIKSFNAMFPPYWLTPITISWEVEGGENGAVECFLADGVNELEGLYKTCRQERNEYRARILEMHAELIQAYVDDDTLTEKEALRKSRTLIYYASRIREGAL